MTDPTQRDKLAANMLQAARDNPDSYAFTNAQIAEALSTPKASPGQVREAAAKDQGCGLPPEGWWCSRAPGHEGPCAARPIESAALGHLISEFTEWPDSELVQLCLAPPPGEHDGEKVVAATLGQLRRAALPKASDNPTPADDVLPVRFIARFDEKEPWIWEVWDVTHTAKCNHFPVARFDSKGASDDFNGQYARACAAALQRSQMTLDDNVLRELADLHNAARGCEFNLVPADGPIARLALFMHENGDRLLAALQQTGSGDAVRRVIETLREGVENTRYSDEIVGRTLRSIWPDIDAALSASAVTTPVGGDDAGEVVERACCGSRSDFPHFWDCHEGDANSKSDASPTTCPQPEHKT